MINDELFQTGDTDSFFVSFTDIVTLLLIFFIYLTTISNFNTSELKTLSEHISANFQIKSITEEITQRPDEKIQTDPWMNIHQTIHHKLLPNEAIRLSLDQSLLFLPGSATLLDGGKIYLKQLADALKGEPYELIIEGHSDSTPIKNDLFKSNWHLSSMRAAEVTAQLEAYGIPGHQLSSRGFAETRPIKAHAKHRKEHDLNRRVQIFIKPLQGDFHE